MVQYCKMSKPNHRGPYQQLGQRLRALRSRAQESLAEASGAVEIDVRDLANFELGSKRPSEEVLLLLISHFGAKDDEAVHLWEMAGYSTAGVSVATSGEAGRTESPILFTDVVDVMVNNFGVVLNFMQSTAPNSSPTTVARVGMSREHAQSVMQILQTTLGQIERQQGAGKLQPGNDQVKN